MKFRKQNTGQFQPGQSGNPSGRPKSENAEVRARLSERSAEVADRVIELALAGDIQAARLVLERVVPPIKASSQPVVLQNLPENPSAADFANAVIRETGEGKIAPDVASGLLTGAAQLFRITELQELRARVEAIEAATRAKKKAEAECKR